MKIAKFDVIDFLDSAEMIEAYLEAAKEENDDDFLQQAKVNVEKAKQFAKLQGQNSS